MKKSTCWLGLLAALSMPSAEAANQEIRALFQPDPSQPCKNVFINKTPNSGYCAEFPAQCAESDMFSIQVPVRFNSTRAIEPGEGLPLYVPGIWRRLTVTNAQTQESEPVEVRIIGIGSNYVLSDSAANLVGVTDNLEGHQKLWTTSTWVNPPAPCQYSGVGAYGTHTYRFFWKAPTQGACEKVAAYRIPAMSFDTFDFAYELRTPNPLGMSSGLYTGSLTYSLGPGRDFSFGPQMEPEEMALNLDFVLDVQHTLKVDLPPGGDKVTLEPAGGWQQWIDGGRIPDRIFRDQMFYISASSRFKVMMQCNSTGGEICKMFGGGDVTQVTVKLTLPAGITHSGGWPVGRFALRHNAWTTTFYPSQYGERQVGMLHFEMPKDAIETLLQPGKSASFSTDITIIWDSEV